MAIAPDPCYVEGVRAEGGTVRPPVPIADQQNLHVVSRRDIDRIVLDCCLIGSAQVKDALVIVAADVVLNHGSYVAEVFFLVAPAGSADQHESALVVVAVVIKKAGISRIVVGVESLAIQRGVSKCRLIQLEKRVICAPGPYARVVTLCALVAMQYDVMLDQGAVRCPGYDAVSAYIFGVVVADNDV